jgi:hypothetical protein
MIGLQSFPISMRDFFVGVGLKETYLLVDDTLPFLLKNTYAKIITKSNYNNFSSVSVPRCVVFYIFCRLKPCQQVTKDKQQTFSDRPTICHSIVDGQSTSPSGPYPAGSTTNSSLFLYTPFFVQFLLRYLRLLGVVPAFFVGPFRIVISLFRFNETIRNGTAS